MPRIQMPLTHGWQRPAPELFSGHIQFFTVLDLANLAWLGVLTSPENVFDTRAILVRSLTADYRNELYPGDAEWNITFPRIGTTSMSVVAEVIQGGVSKATVKAELVQVHMTERRALALNEGQRAFLERLTVSPA